ncbi:MAG: YcgL domain-containing protein [Gammaproteobacteria bacterium]
MIDMPCFIYKSLNKQHYYLYLGKKDDFSGVPEPLLDHLGKLELILEIDLTPERKLAKENAAKVIAGLIEKGYFLQMPAIAVPAPASLQ